MIVNEKIFLERYHKLNERQKEAVDTIFGPVMVIAGPGTGKTEVLSMRIANLLRSEVQVLPQEILCLTYTDEATNSMRKRLLQIIGTAAHKVNIFTFHAFCNNIIQNHSEYFSLRTLQPVTDLERAGILHTMLEELQAGHPLRKLTGNIYYDAARLNKLFDLMKREHLTTAYMAEAIDVYVESLPERDSFKYKNNGKNHKKGDIKEGELKEELKRMSETKAAVYLFDEYERRMKEAGRYDFNDMIIWVLEAFKEQEWMLLSYQERYQYILVDEYQDTNGAQNDIITALTSYWEDPNIFVVGDDDQSIYEFQGARIRNIVDYYQRHQQTMKIIVLADNYRSSQEILDKAMAAIKNNDKRLIAIEELKKLGLNKDIKAASERFKTGTESIKPVIKVYNNILHEEADIVMQIEQLQQQGISLNEIAVLYSQHRQAENIMALMERRGIPYNAKKQVNILDLPVTEQLLNILRYIDTEKKKTFDGEQLLFELMHCPYFGIEPSDIALIALYLQSNKKDKYAMRWRVVLSNPLLLESLELRSGDAIRRLGDKLDNWERSQSELPLPLLVEKIVYESGIVAYLLKTTDHIWNIQALYTFFEFVKDIYNREQKIKVSELLQIVEKMNREQLPVPVQKVVQSNNGVYFYTAHSAKGNEFEHVYLVGCTKNFWEGKRGGGNEFRMPDTITKTEEDTDKTYKTEVARRLFYVALTRAKKHLQVSYAEKDNAGKPIENSVFIDEISTPNERVKTHLSEEETITYLQWAMQPVPEVQIKMANAEWIEKILQQLTMSATTLSRYLDCPLSFYYENILKVPFQKNDALAFGTAVHYALEHLFLEMKRKNDTFPDKGYVLSSFDREMKAQASCFTDIQYERRIEQGHSILSDYYDRYIDTFEKNVEVEIKIPRYMLDGVPVTGKIDKLEIDGDDCKVVDYKTGNPDNAAKDNISQPNENNKNGGDYWRQMVFYKLLIEHYPDWNRTVNMGVFDFIQKSDKGEFKQVTVPVFKQDEELVLKQLKDSFGSIMNHEFDKGCGEETCRWCNFARRYDLVRPRADKFVEIDDV